MHIVEKTTSHEMARRFAIGEVRSKSFFTGEEHYRQETICLLKSDNYDLQCQGIKRHWKRRGSFVKSLPMETEWNLAKLCLSDDEFGRLRTVNDPGWVNYTKETLRLIDAANFLKENTNKDPRVAAVISACKQGQLEFCGITLFGRTLEGQLTIVEGTARLVAIYLSCILQKSSPLCAEEIEVVLGLSQRSWCFS